MTSQIDPTASIARDVVFGAFCVVMADVVIEAGTIVGHHVVIHPGTKIRPNVQVQDFAVLGKRNFKTSGTGSSTKQLNRPEPLVIERDAIIGTGAIVYAGSIIGEGSIIADRAIIREGCRLGKKVKVGKQAIVEYEVSLEDGVSLQAFVLVGEQMIVGKDSFLGPHVSTACDPSMATRSGDKIHAPRIHERVRVGENCTIFPGVEIGRGTIVGAASAVARSLPEGVLALGNPARPIKRVSVDDEVSG